MMQARQGFLSTKEFGVVKGLYDEVLEDLC